MHQAGYEIESWKMGQLLQLTPVGVWLLIKAPRASGLNIVTASAGNGQRCCYWLSAPGFLSGGSVYTYSRVPNYRAAGEHNPALMKFSG